MKIYKYSLLIADHQTIEMPGGATVIHVGFDPVGQPCLWAIVDPDAVKVPYDFYMIGTGHVLPDGLVASRHRGTFVWGPFVWHVFE